MEYKLTMHYQHSKEGKDGKRKSYYIYFLNDVEILKQKAPFDETMEEGFNGKWYTINTYLFNGKLYQTRCSTMCNGEPAGRVRFVSYPVSKKILRSLEVPNNIKIIECK